jgi:tetratricopeptide (TPR) repeat protein
MKRLPQLIFLLFSCLAISTFAQSKSATKTDVNKDVDVVKVYEQVAKDGYGTPYIYEELANAYYFKNEYEKAKKWFEKLFDVQKPLDATLIHRYRQTLKALDLEFKGNRYLAVSGTN